ncbi:BcPKS19, polyketide synthase [Hyaloscypha variabilis F]|uniref:BcPKS19, polyketide synthase n=1 Tax=Hyaloscypha variabilis (strain UAMH 11265 / GT02V1 / F) TaxID=1149755 RepID=A0A2J6RL28_HYAVF|nr:BcPKS19, polyketide synthase [Hyaloscypha variabilis F]
MLGQEVPEARHSIEVPPNRLNNGPSINSIHKSTNGILPSIQPKESEYPPHSIAITGMACRFPDADSTEEFWDLLLAGTSIVEPAPERLKLPKADDQTGTKWWGSFLRNPETFDHRFFKKSSREALSWDPQTRILMEVVYEAMESSGYFGANSEPEPNDYGLYVGAVMSNWYDNVSCQPPSAYATIGTSRCFFSGSVSHHFGWTGPALTIDTACSSSLVAINAACKAIISGECSRAVAGGTNVFTSPFDYRNLQAAGFLSPTGACKPFDGSGDGYCRGEGVGVVVLKKLEDAIRENDNILGVIVGSAMNQNHHASHITVPHSGSQINLYNKVMNLAGVTPESVSYIEAHGTGTGVGDPIECHSIRHAFGGPQRDQTLHFASVKGNIGHTEATAGIAGLIKVLLMMQHSKIPPQANFKTLNPNIPPLEKDRMEIPTSILKWSPPVRLACVNSYGAAGSNAAVIVRQKPDNLHRLVSNVAQHVSQYPVFISAASPNSLSTYCEKLLGYIQQIKSQKTYPELLSDLTFNLADRANHSLPYTFSTTVTDVTDLENKLAEAASASTEFRTESPQIQKPVVLVFSGQENDFIGISEEFCQSFSLFRHYLRQCDDILLSLGYNSIFPAFFQRTSIKDIVILHSALFSMQYASAKAWMDCGLAVSAVIGHSFGQLTALCISGCLSLKDALKLVAGRASIMLEHWGPERGNMLWVGTNRQKVSDILGSLNPKLNGDYVEIACYNSPESHVAVGSTLAIQSLEKYIASEASLRGIRTKKLRVTHGFHSKFTDALLPYISSLAKSLTWNKPTIHLETCDDSGSVSEPGFQLVPDHTRKPVFFEQAVKRLAQKYGACTWLDVGLSPSFVNLVKGSLASNQLQNSLLLAPQYSTSVYENSLIEITVNLWRAGYSIQYWPFHRSCKPQYQFLSLPPYQFEKTNLWLDFADRTATPATLVIEETPKHELLTFVKFIDSAKKEAVFRVSPESDRYQYLVKGHVMAGQALMPASLSFELISRAALFLQGEAAVISHVPCVESLHMKSPIGLDKKKDILLTLRRTQDVKPSWSFNISTQAHGTMTSERFEHTTGLVYLERRDDTRAARSFKRFETLIGSRRCEEIIDDPDAEKMQGNHLYRAFNHIVHYGEQFRGIKSISSVHLEAAGKVVMPVDPQAPADQRLCDTPMTESFMGFAGFLVNYFYNTNLDEVYICSKIERIETGGSFSPDAKEWIAYSTMTENDDGDAAADAYVFDPASKKLVFAAFGCQFSKMSQALLARMLKGVNQSNDPARSAKKAIPQKLEIAHDDFESDSSGMSSKREEFFTVLHNVTDIPLEEIKDDSTLDDLGIDSLMATELLNDVRAAFGVTIDLTTLLFFPNMRAAWEHLDSKLGISPVLNTPASSEGISEQHGVTAEELIEKLPETVEELEEPLDSPLPSLDDAYQSFQEIKYGFDKHAIETKAAKFWDAVYPDEARLVLAYVVEGFAALGCDVNALQLGESVPEIQALPRHESLVRQLYNILEDGQLICTSGDGYIRTKVAVDTTPAEAIYAQLLQSHPQHANLHKLVQDVGAHLAACLTGEKDVLQLTFGNKTNKENLEDVYENWPLLRTPALLLGDFLLKAFSQSSGRGKFKILEVGAGTGGTTKYMVNYLKKHGIDFEYTFTDLSARLVADAKKRFKSVEGMVFKTLDLEKEPFGEMLGGYHIIIATNCVHATRRLEQTLGNVRKMLRDDGALILVEMTKNIFCLDIAWGLFEGWWLFEDERTHALVDERHWERVLKIVGFESVSWSDGESPESQTVRLIAGFPVARPEEVVLKEKKVQFGMEAVIYKQLGSLAIHADVYYPLVPSPEKRPIALMIHGGSHMIFSRKDVRPAQTRLLLERGFIPVSIDHRLCPEVSLAEGPMVDVCDALEWARYELPYLKFQNSPGLQIDGRRVVVIGWSSGGQLAMSLGWTAPQRGLKPPDAVLAFYSPTDYEDEWWRTPIQPRGAEDSGEDYDLLEGVHDSPITSYDKVGAWEPFDNPRVQTDPRFRLILHINWKAQTLPVIIGGLPSKSALAASNKSSADIMHQPQPAEEKLQQCSPRAQIVKGNYKTPTFFIHGTDDELIPWQMTQGTYEVLRDSGVVSGMELVRDVGHICDLSSEPESEGWKATVKGYEFLFSFIK